MSASLGLEVLARSTYTVVRLSGEITLLTSAGVGPRLDELVDGGDLVLDLGRLEFLDSAGIHLLFKTARRARERGSRIALVVPQEAPIRRVLQIADPGDSLCVRDSEDEAAEALAVRRPAG